MGNHPRDKLFLTAKENPAPILSHFSNYYIPLKEEEEEVGTIYHSTIYTDLIEKRGGRGVIGGAVHNIILSASSAAAVVDLYPEQALVGTVIDARGSMLP